jgi:hypothetical protein
MTESSQQTTGISNQSNGTTNMNSLNNRFSNFVNTVRSQSKHSEYLQRCLLDTKKEYLKRFLEQNAFYIDDLLANKRLLNELVLGLNKELIRQRHSFMLSEWYSKLYKFETDNSRLKRYFTDSTQSFHHDYNMLNMKTQSNHLKVSLESETEVLNEQTAIFNDFSFNLSEESKNMSTSHSSLISNSSAISSYSSSSSTTCSSGYSIIMQSNENETPPLMARTSTPYCLSSATGNNIFLENYLNQIIKNRIQIKLEHDSKSNEVAVLKENVSKLNTDLSHLNSDLDDVRVENRQLSGKIDNLKTEIEFYKKLSTSKTSKKETNSSTYNTITQFDKEKWLHEELPFIKREIKIEFKDFYQEQIESHEESLENEFYCELDTIESELNEESLQFELEYDQVIDELIELNKELEQSITEYEELSRTNFSLNDRLIKLSDKLCSFSQSSIDDQEKMFLNYSVKDLSKRVENRRVQIEQLKKELKKAKGKQLKSNQSSNQKINESSQKHNFKMRPSIANIEYTKSNMFGYLMVKFDLINEGYLSAKSFNSNTKSNNSLHNIKIIHDSIDGHSIVIENNHKLLDFDLSEWTIRREIMNKMPDNCSNLSDLLMLLENNNEVEVIEYKFPKGFRLKRRNKINLIASGESMSFLVNMKNLNQLDSNKCVQFISKFANQPNYCMNKSKCSCSSCQMFLKLEANLELVEIKEVSNWGFGVLVLTKFINNKNTVKLVDYKFLKDIWVNNCEFESCLN